MSATCAQDESTVTFRETSSLIQFAVKAKILAAQHLRDVEDLAIVHPKMLHDLIDGVQAANGITLDLKSHEQIGFS